jgi:hypothetical protein
VTIDGEQIEPELGLPEGFIVIPVPAGDHLVEVRFRDTPPRQLAWGLTTLSLLLAAVVGWRFGQRREESASAVGWQQADRQVLAGVMGVTAVTLLILGPLNLLHDSSANYLVERAQNQRYDDFGGQIALIGYDLSQETAVPGDLIALTLYWQAQTELAINFQSFVHLLGPDGALVAQSDRLNPGEFPTRRWPLDKYVRDVHQFQLPANLPPGEYTLTAGLWVQTEGWRLPLRDASGVQLDDKATLGTLTVR